MHMHQTDVRHLRSLQPALGGLWATRATLYIAGNLLQKLLPLGWLEGRCKVRSTSRPGSHPELASLPYPFCRKAHWHEVPLLALSTVAHSGGHHHVFAQPLYAHPCTIDARLITMCSYASAYVSALDDMVWSMDLSTVLAFGES